jgi:hypothetical protein
MQRERVECLCGAVVPEPDAHRYGAVQTVACPRCGLRQTWGTWNELGRSVARHELGVRPDRRLGDEGEGRQRGR